VATETQEDAIVVTVVTLHPGFSTPGAILLKGGRTPRFGNQSDGWMSIQEAD
jgi:hypothetical protein